VPNERVVVYIWGLCNASVCAPAGMTLAEIERDVNRQLPTGIESPWKKDEAPTFADGETNPCPCERDPGMRVHYLLSC
jgi:hypothetical protein